MKKLSKIFAVVLVLAMVLSVLPLGAAAAAESVTFDFSSVITKYSTQKYDVAGVKKVLDDAASAAGYLTAVSKVDYVYPGNESGGDFSKLTGCMKLGKSKTAGQLDLTFSKNVVKVEILCHDYHKPSTKYPNPSKTIAVNGGATQNAAYNANGTFEVRTFNLTASKTVSIKTSERIYVKSITVTFEGAGSGGGSVTPPPAPSASEGTIAQVLAGAADSLWKTTGAINLIEGQNVYIQDATGAICVRLSAAPTDLAVGDNVTVEGTLGEYKKLPQLNVDAAKCEKVSTTITVTPKAVTIATLDKADLCKVVKLSGVTVTEIDDSYGSGTPNVTVSDGTNDIQIYKAVVPAGLAVGDKIDLVASLSCYNDKLQLRNDNAADITKVVADDDDDNDDTNNNDNTGDNTGDTTVKDPDKVGDNTAIVAMTSVMAIAVVALAVLVIGKKRMF